MRTSSLTLLAFGLMATTAHAALVVSRAASSNVTCVSGTCTATAANAVLNVRDAKHLLSQGDLTIASGAAAMDIEIVTTFTWARPHRLTLDAFRSIVVSQPVTSEGTGGVTLTTNDGGTGGDYSFVDKGKIAFLDTTSSLVINTRSYTLVSDVASLASGIASDPAGTYALTQGYDASVDGRYANAAVPTSFTGIFEGLGHAVMNISIKGDTTHSLIGFFAQVASGGVVRDFRLTTAVVQGRQHVGALAGTNAGTFQSVSSTGGFVSGGPRRDGMVGGLVGFNQGTIVGASTAAQVGASGSGFAGGLVGLNDGSIALSSASGPTSGAGGSAVGGLVGTNTGTIATSWASGAVSVADTGQHGSDNAGGLVGVSSGAISQSYALGAVTGGDGQQGQDNTYFVYVGGLVGSAGNGSVSQSYSTDHVSGGNLSYVGGTVGRSGPPTPVYSALYWDTTASGTVTGCGSGDCTGAAGQTTAQLKSGLPAGFDPGAWAESGGVIGGYPYLVANPPE